MSVSSSNLVDLMTPDPLDYEHSILEQTMRNESTNELTVYDMTWAIPFA